MLYFLVAHRRHYGGESRHGARKKDPTRLPGIPGEPTVRRAEGPWMASYKGGRRLQPELDLHSRDRARRAPPATRSRTPYCPRLPARCLFGLLVLDSTIRATGCTIFGQADLR